MLQAVYYAELSAEGVRYAKIQCQKASDRFRRGDRRSGRGRLDLHFGQ